MANANGIGASTPRKEDLRFLKGEGRYTDDLRKPGQLYAAFVRAGLAHATIGSIRSEAASRVKGVVAVLTGEDYRADGHGPIPHQAIEGNPADEKSPAFTENDPVALCFGQWPLPFDKVRHAGEAVAVVIAASITRGKSSHSCPSMSHTDQTNRDLRSNGICPRRLTRITSPTAYGPRVSISIAPGGAGGSSGAVTATEADQTDCPSALTEAVRTSYSSPLIAAHRSVMT